MSDLLRNSAWMTLGFLCMVAGAAVICACVGVVAVGATPWLLLAVIPSFFLTVAAAMACVQRIE